MPKSKRNKQVELAKTKKRGLEWKKRLFEEVRSSVDSYTNAFVFSVNDMRNSKMKNVREQWKHSRFFIGKNKIMAMALGRFAEEEYKPNLHKVGQQIKGQRGLLFSNKSTEEVLSWFRSYSEGDFARSGKTATEDVNLMVGPLSQFPHSLEPYLRQLGLPTSLVKGVIHLVKDHEVCRTGDTLTPETAKILKMLGYEMAEFHVTINCVWSQDGTFMQFTEDVDTDTKENLKKKKKKKSNSFKIEKPHKSPDIEEMEVEDDDDDENENQPDSSEFINGDTSYCLPKITTEEESTSLNSCARTSEEKSNNLEENNEVIEVNPVISSQKEEIQDFIEETPKDAKKKKTEDSSSPKVSSFVSQTASPKENSNLEENNEVIEINPVISSQKEEIEKFSEETPKDTEKKTEESSNDVKDKNKDSGSRKSRPRKRKGNGEKPALKNDSLLKTPDPNTSLDSPVFRELRNRSVKVSRKKKK